jgi:hypothetical protein
LLEFLKRVGSHDRDHPIEHVGVDLITAHHGEASALAVGIVGRVVLLHWAEDAVRLLDLPQESGIAAGPEQERQLVGDDVRIGEGAKRGLALLFFEFEQLLLDVVDIGEGRAWYFRLQREYDRTGTFLLDRDVQLGFYPNDFKDQGKDPPDPDHLPAKARAVNLTPESSRLSHSVDIFGPAVKIPAEWGHSSVAAWFPYLGIGLPDAQFGRLSPRGDFWYLVFGGSLVPSRAVHHPPGKMGRRCRAAWSPRRFNSAHMRINSIARSPHE